MGVTSIIRLQKTVASVLLADSVSLCLVSLMKLAVREAHVARNWGWPLADSQQGAESCQQPVSANNCWVNLDADHTPAEPWED